MGRFDMKNGYKDSQVKLVRRKRKAKHHETRYGDSDFEACCSNKKRRIDTPNKEGTFEAMDFASSRKRKQESIFTSTECANMFKEDIIHRHVKELGNTKLSNKLYQLKKLGVRSKLLERMRWEGGGLGKCGQGIFLSIENEEEDEELSRPLKKKKTKHVTNDDLRLLELNKTIMIVKENQDDPKRNQLDGLEVNTSSLNQLNNESHSGTLSLKLLGNSFMYMKNRFPDEYKLYGLSTIACSFALPLFSILFKGWDPQIKLTDHTDIMSVWKDLLQGNEIDSPYAQLFMEVVLCAVMRSSINTWQAKHPEPLLWFLYSGTITSSSSSSENSRLDCCAKIIGNGLLMRPTYGFNSHAYLGSPLATIIGSKALDFI
nr:septin and tuftelin-interacting protein 1 homolog 1 [Tanacetum cinerariifolium]